MKRKDVEELLADAMGLLHNIEQRRTAGWKKDYADVCARYELEFLGFEEEEARKERGNDDG